ncbi:hypothetical protein NC797_07190 [Aquibacillus sp. 3ASR75-11]|uniref:Uncharacterized protein n=1 Tax=Terrihalobacillus insolitus TaxID=2950438 RepID=A0A9X3WR02_9BACI|nr:hypothetical protein [Terrihalobacillus insolitus]MDC3424292.1 hypothetical protein [Terrihalobacillus insolitus]
MEIDMKDLLEEKFEDDPLRREIKINKLENDLYTDSILSMHPDTTYSTVEAGDIIGRKDSTLRNYFRTELLEYIGPDKFGKYYRLDYISVFKLHMILLLVEKANKSTSDLAYFCGLAPLVSTGNNKRNGQGNNSNTPSTNNNQMLQEMDQLKRIMFIQTLRAKLADEKSSLTNLEVKISNTQREIDSLEKNIELATLKHQNEKVERKYHRMLDYSLKNTVAKNTGTQKWSLKNLFKGPESSGEIDVDKVMKEAVEIANNEREEEANKEIEQNKQLLEEKKKSIEVLNDNLQQQKEKVADAERKMIDYQKNPDQLSSEHLSQLLLSDSSTQQE